MTPDVILSAGPLQVHFQWQGDRFAQLVEWVEHVLPAPLLQSIEGGAEENWPPSPVLQSLHLEQRSDAVCVALLVGMAGGSHWSLAVEADRAARMLRYDVACRVRSQTQFLGSSWRRFADSHVLPTWRIEPCAGSCIHCSNLTIQLQPDALPDRFPATVRWQFQLVANTVNAKEG